MRCLAWLSHETSFISKDDRLHLNIFQWQRADVGDQRFSTQIGDISGQGDFAVKVALPEM